MSDHLPQDIDHIKLDELESQMDEVTSQVESMLKHGEEISKLTIKIDSISQWSARQHLEHLCVASRSTLSLIDMALLSNEESPEGMNESGYRLFSLGHFPRGQTQSPEFALPRDAKDEKIKKSLKRYRDGLAAFNGRKQEIQQCKKTSSHPFLGGLSASQWFCFLNLHQHHHLSIIDEIIQG